ncbi:MAG: hypothetical protein RLZZ141_40 [Pseudomonadota bacterium]|jgi:HlyD family secretion protein
MNRPWGARIAIGAGLIGLVLVATGLLFVPRPVDVDSILVSQGPISETVSDQGVAKVREAYLVSTPVSGRLERLDLHVGDPVLADRTVVARIYPASADPLDPRARAQAQAVLAAARAAQSAAMASRDQMAADAQRAGSNLNRTQALADRGFASVQTLETALAQDRAARAALRAAEAQIRVRQSEVGAAQAALIGPEREGALSISVTAPVAGRVTRVLQESARYVPAGTALIEVSDQAGLEAAIEFLSQDAVRISEGMAAQIYDWGGAVPITATVRRVEPQGFTKISALGVEEQRVLVMLQLVGDPKVWETLGPGYRLWGRVVLRRKDQVTTVPIGALVRIGGRWAVFTIRQGRAYLSLVTIGILTDQKAEVKEGLKPNDRVVLYPSDRVADGVRVREQRVEPVK